MGKYSADIKKRIDSNKAIIEKAVTDWVAKKTSSLAAGVWIRLTASDSGIPDEDFIRELRTDPDFEVKQEQDNHGPHWWEVRFKEKVYTQADH